MGQKIAKKKVEQSADEPAIIACHYRVILSTQSGSPLIRDFLSAVWRSCANEAGVAQRKDNLSCCSMVRCFLGVMVFDVVESGRRKWRRARGLNPRIVHPSCVE